MIENDIDLRIRWAEFGEVIYPAGGTAGPRLQPNYQLVLLRQGSCRVELDDEVYTVPPNSVFLLIPGREEFFRFDESVKTDHAWVHFQWAACPTVFSHGLPVLPYFNNLTERMETLIRLGVETRSFRPEERQHCLNRLAELVFYEFMEQCPSWYSPAPPLHFAIRSAQRYIDIHWSEKLRLKEIARHAHMTPRHLTRLFKNHLGETPIQYLWNLRTTKAIGLLQSSGLRINEIARQTGFQSPSHFTRAIKERTGYSPRSVRKRHWNANRTTTSDS